MVVKPDCQAIVYLLPGSQGKVFTSRLAYLRKLVIIDWSSGISQPFCRR